PASSPRASACCTPWSTARCTWARFRSRGNCSALSPPPTTDRLTMNRTDRLMGILLEFQAHGERRAEDLARVFEVSVRTVYRDVEALCEAGVPVVATPGK